MFIFFSGCVNAAIGFRDDVYYSYVIYHIFGTSQLLASIGGFLSLIGGVSIISLFEIFYFLGCRNLKRKLTQVSSEISTNPTPEVKSNAFAKFLIKYSKLSSIHGLNNAEEGRVFGLLIMTFYNYRDSCNFLFFRMTLLFVLIISVMICFRTIRDTYNRADSNPISFKIDEHTWSSKEVNEKFLVKTLNTFLLYSLDTFSLNNNMP